MSTLSVVERILREASVPMSVRQIVERAGAALPTKSKTPDTVVARDLSMDIKRRGDDSLFVRTSPGRYGMRTQQAAAALAASPTSPVQATPPAPTTPTTTSISEQAIGESHTRTKPAPRVEESRESREQNSDQVTA